MDTTSDPHGASTRRWTAAQSAAFVHDRLLAPRGFERRRTRSERRDFVERAITFYTLNDGDDSVLFVSFDLAWAGMPAGVPEDAWTTVGGTLRKTYPQPSVAEHALDGELMDSIEGHVLEYLMRPQSPIELVDQLLGYEEKKHPVLDHQNMYPSAHYMAAAWGALLIGEADRCAQGAQRAREEIDREGVPATLAYHLEHQIEVVADLWRVLHGMPIPRAL